MTTTPTAAAVAHAERALADADQALSEAVAAADPVAARLAAIDAERASLIQRRASVGPQPGDGAELELLTVDRAGLTEIGAPLEAEVDAARQRRDAATAALAGAQHHHRRAVDEAHEASLISHAVALDALLLGTIAKLGELHSRLGRGRPVWNASAKLREQLRVFTIQRGDLG